MTRETLFRIIDWAVASTPPGDRLDFGFFGGEPLLRRDLMAEGSARAHERAAEAGIPLHLTVTTNGTTLDDSALAMVEQYGIDLCVSIDGPARIHDMHRRFRNGRGSAAAVAANLVRALARLDRVQVNSVYGPSTVDALPDAVAYLFGLGVRLIHLNLDISATWPPESHPRIREAYQRVGEMVVESYRRRDPIAVNLVDNKIILFLKDGYGPEDRCGMGKTKFGFAPTGEMYPCERLIQGSGDSRLCLGNASAGPDPIRVVGIAERTGNRNLECRDCPVRRFCMNWCGCTNYYLTGRTDVAAPVLCASEKAAIATAQATMEELANDGLFIDHLLAYLRDAQHPLEGVHS